MIRPARGDDASRLAAIHLAAWRKGCETILPSRTLAGATVDGRTQEWSRRLASAGSRTFVCERDGSPVGLATLARLRANGRPSRSLLELRLLYVAPPCWRRGVGRELHQHVHAEAQGQGFRQLILWVLRDNLRARAFYEALGYAPDRGRQVRLGGHTVDETRYRLALDPT